MSKKISLYRNLSFSLPLIKMKNENCVRMFDSEKCYILKIYFLNYIPNVRM